MKKEEKQTWIIRYGNGQIGSFLGTRQEAELHAREKAKEKNTEYKIV